MSEVSLSAEALEHLTPELAARVLEGLQNVADVSLKDRHPWVSVAFADDEWLLIGEVPSPSSPDAMPYFDGLPDILGDTYPDDDKLIVVVPEWETTTTASLTVYCWTRGMEESIVLIQKMIPSKKGIRGRLLGMQTGWAFDGPAEYQGTGPTLRE